MRIKRNYLGALKRKKDWLVSRFKPLTIHTEAIMIDSVWEKIKDQVKKGKIQKWFIMTPANYDYYKADFSISLSREKLSEIMKKRYKWMLEHKQKLELHIHLSMIMDNMSYKEQEALFKESITWTKKELGIEVKEFVPGWWSYNQDTLKILKKFNLKLITPKDYDFIHDYNWVL